MEILVFLLFSKPPTLLSRRKVRVEECLYRFLINSTYGPGYYSNISYNPSTI